MFGPKSRDLIKSVSEDNFDNDNFKFATAKYITIEGIKIWAQRLSYVGELGFELYIETNKAKEIYKPMAERNLKWYLIRCAIIQSQSFEISKEDISNEIEDRKKINPDGRRNVSDRSC